MGSGGGSTQTGIAGPSGDAASCFVATACYGKHADITDSLRLWRDNVLSSKHKAKVLFIKFYYAVWGSPGGRLLCKLPFLKPVARRLILLFMKINGIKIRAK